MQQLHKANSNHAITRTFQLNSDCAKVINESGSDRKRLLWENFGRKPAIFSAIEKNSRRIAKSPDHPFPEKVFEFFFFKIEVSKFEDNIGWKFSWILYKHLITEILELSMNGMCWKKKNELVTSPTIRRNTLPPPIKKTWTNGQEMKL